MKSKLLQPWLLWLSGLGVLPQPKLSRVQFPVRAHAWVVRLAPSQGACENQLIDVSLSRPRFSLSFFLPPVLSKKINNLKIRLLQCAVPSALRKRPSHTSLIHCKGVGGSQWKVWDMLIILTQHHIPKTARLYFSPTLVDRKNPEGCSTEPKILSLYREKSVKQGGRSCL